MYTRLIVKELSLKRGSILKPQRADPSKPVLSFVCNENIPEFSQIRLLRTFDPLALRMLLPIKIVGNDEDESCQIYTYYIPLERKFHAL